MGKGAGFWDRAAAQNRGVLTARPLAHAVHFMRTPSCLRLQIVYSNPILTSAHTNGVLPMFRVAGDKLPFRKFYTLDQVSAHTP